MIDFLRGNIAHKETDYIVLDVGGVGYRVFCSNPFVFQSGSDEDVTVYIHHNVREDAILLFGFQTRAEQALFRKLLDVSGIGPRVALGILSGGRPEAVVAAIQQENVAVLTKLPGIGKKTAQRIILDLKDKMNAFAAAPWDQLHAGSLAAAAQESLGHSGIAWSEAKEGLLALGYSEAEVDRAWHAIQTKVSESDTVDILMKLALQALFKG